MEIFSTQVVPSMECSYDKDSSFLDIKASPDTSYGIYFVDKNAPRVFKELWDQATDQDTSGNNESSKRPMSMKFEALDPSESDLQSIKAAVTASTVTSQKIKAKAKAKEMGGTSKSAITTGSVSLEGIESSTSSSTAAEAAAYTTNDDINVKPEKKGFLTKLGHGFTKKIQKLPSVRQTFTYMGLGGKVKAMTVEEIRAVMNGLTPEELLGQYEVSFNAQLCRFVRSNHHALSVYLSHCLSVSLSLPLLFKLLNETLIYEYTKFVL